MPFSLRRLPRLADHARETLYLQLFPDAGLHRQNRRALEDARMTAKTWLKIEE